MVEIRSKEDLSGIGRILFHWTVGAFQLVALGEFGKRVPEEEASSIVKQVSVANLPIWALVTSMMIILIFDHLDIT